jgi:hypothetical protein
VAAVAAVDTGAAEQGSTLPGACPGVSSCPQVSSGPLCSCVVAAHCISHFVRQGVYASSVSVPLDTAAEVV